MKYIYYVSLFILYMVICVSVSILSPWPKHPSLPSRLVSSALTSGHRYGFGMGCDLQQPRDLNGEWEVVNTDR